MDKAVIWDIDGTLASNAWRVPLAIGPRPDWDMFYDLAALDAPIPRSLEMLLADLDEGLSIQILTARPARVRYATEWWLAENGIPYDTLHMRPRRFVGKAPVMKRAALQHIRSRFQVLRAYDDDPRNLAMFVDEGIEAVQVWDPLLPPLAPCWC